MRQDHGGGVELQRVLEHLARVDGRLVHRAPEHHVGRDQPVKAFGDLSKIVLPSGMVDFVQYKTQYIFDYTLWNSAVLERITQDTPIEVSLTALFRSYV